MSFSFSSLLVPRTGAASLRCANYARRKAFEAWRWSSSSSGSAESGNDRAGSSTKPEKPAQKPKSTDDAPPIPLLQRPLGLRQPPIAAERTWSTTREELMDQDVRMAQREQLIKEVGKGYFTDLNATRHHGGKTWIAPNVNIREDKALYFPNMMGTTLDGKKKQHTTSICRGNISVVSMLNSRMSEIHVKGFTEPTNARFLSNPLYKYVQVNLQENLLKSFLVSLFLSSIAKATPAELHPTYMVSSQNMDFVREPLGMVNRHVGYVYLLDENLRVRWAGCADAKAEETAALEKCVGVLLARLEQSKKGKAKKS
ncbi:hypothetical protein CONPUDRAFT_128126 [Coniophora puteana RWD-64-598 SS2]|uniref:F1F0 ATP synthase assembly protein Atp10 n=1 Tax=Coniophora puteana (strain RWD-64-598) TaxID=741705 RepID=A0A5M3MHR2_CONPW|nr:uncharacterized protein CONPUDRAFT_128126 [Coniophora puteana RWD-64-598 SS2]EIW78480.1 hypothetical protein CONPUDRAFT_128126 [Coniophora puteana RWD-64-598 SS2]